MFWVGVSLLVMSLTGLGDDTRAFLRYVAGLQKATEAVVQEAERQASLHAMLAELEAGFRRQRETLKLVGDCVGKVDRSYRVTREDYFTCTALGEHVMSDAAEVLIDVRHRLQASTTDEEREQIRARVLGK